LSSIVANSYKLTSW